MQCIAEVTGAFICSAGQVVAKTVEVRFYWWMARFGNGNVLMCNMPACDSPLPVGPPPPYRSFHAADTLQVRAPSAHWPWQPGGPPSCVHVHKGRRLARLPVAGGVFHPAGGVAACRTCEPHTRSEFSVLLHYMCTKYATSYPRPCMASAPCTGFCHVCKQLLRRCTLVQWAQVPVRPLALV